MTIKYIIIHLNKVVNRLIHTKHPNYQFILIILIFWNFK